jgi:hypothetical protein
MSAKKRVCDDLESLLPRLDFGAVHQLTIWHVQICQSRSDNCRKARAKEQLRTETIPAISTGMFIRLAIRHMLAVAASQETQALEKPQHRAWSGRTRRKILDMPRRSCDDSATPSDAFPVARAEICKGTRR